MQVENLERVRSAIKEALERSGRGEEAITLVAVTKNHPHTEIEQAFSLGITHIAENRVQEAAEKFSNISRFPPTNVKHLIGHLQANKVKKALDVFDRIDSVDSLALLERINRLATTVSKVQDCLIQVKLSSEDAKTGLDANQLEICLDRAQSMKQVRVLGLMGMAPYCEDPQAARPFFRGLKELFVRFFSSQEAVLSMGMSHDFSAAIAEGATEVRIGTALFGNRIYA